MGERHTPIHVVRDRLTGLLADWGAELSSVLKELDDKRARIDELQAQAAGRDAQLTALQVRVGAQDTLIDTLKADAQESGKLRKEVHNKGVELAQATAELAALDARKTLIKSLRADQDRVGALETSLEEKRDVIVELEASINRHAGTITELKRSADEWKRKYYAALKAGSAGDAAAAPPPSLNDTDPRVLESLASLDKTVEARLPPDATIAIDMRRSLLEARRTASQGHGDK